MRAKQFLWALPVLTLCSVVSLGAFAQDLSSGDFWHEDDLAFEFIGQVKNSPPAGPGLPFTSVQYGYLSHITGISDKQIFAPGNQSDSTARYTFYNDAVRLSLTVHGNLRIVTRAGTTTVYYHQNPHGDLATPNPDSFRDGTPVLTTKWRHHVVFDATDPAGYFFVNFFHKVTSSVNFATVEGNSVRLADVGEKLRMSLVGSNDPAGLVDGKFAGIVTRSANQ